MSDLHTIRLHGPWQASIIERFDQAVEDPIDSQPASSTRVKIPSSWNDWLGELFRGRVSYRRPFNIPTQLEPNQKVWLVVESVAGTAAIFLNDCEIGCWQSGEPPFRANIRSNLAPHNVLRIEVTQLPAETTQSAGGLTGSVRLEIEQ